MEMTYYAHTAQRPDGSPDPNPRCWQRLRDHLRNVAALAKRFAAPPELSAESKLDDCMISQFRTTKRERYAH